MPVDQEEMKEFERKYDIEVGDQFLSRINICAKNKNSSVRLKKLLDERTFEASIKQVLSKPSFKFNQTFLKDLKEILNKIDPTYGPKFYKVAEKNFNSFRDSIDKPIYEQLKEIVKDIYEKSKNDDFTKENIEKHRDNYLKNPKLKDLLSTLIPDLSEEQRKDITHKIVDATMYARVNHDYNPISWVMRKIKRWINPERYALRDKVHNDFKTRLVNKKSHEAEMNEIKESLTNQLKDYLKSPTSSHQKDSKGVKTPEKNR